jgi:serine/threonine protein kinase
LTTENRHVFGSKSGGASKSLAKDSNDNFSETSSLSLDDSTPEESLPQVIAKVSIHALREERAYHISKNLTLRADPWGDRIARPIDLLRLPAQQGDKGSIVVSIFEDAGPNALEKYMDFGPAWYKGRKLGNTDIVEVGKVPITPVEQVSLPTFLEFAIGATECLEVLHHGQRIVHGEIRGDAFHFNETTGQVRFINFGFGLRSFEHGLTSSGWSTLSQEAGAKTKLSYISPEQTGRMPAEPDSRTDIYSLGILFWILLTQQPAFDGSTPMDIIQGVLGRRLPSVSSVRPTVPDVLGNIISKMTAKSIGDRYHSASGLRHDLIEVQSLLGDGNSEALRDWKIATKDVSSFFILPTVMIGRSREHDEIVKIIDMVAKRHMINQKQSVYSLSSGSSLMDAEGSSISGDSSKEWLRKDSTAALSHPPGDPRVSNYSNSLVPSTPSSQHNSFDSQDSVHGNTQMKPWEKSSPLFLETRGSAEGASVDTEGQRGSSEGAGSLTSQKNQQKFRREGRCEVISIAGAAGLGKSCLVQSVQVKARRRGYFASSKFDRARSTPFGPVLRLLSSLFKQVFSESNTETQFHDALKHFVRPVWPMLHRVLNLPEFLLGPSSSNLQNQPLPSLGKGYQSVHTRTSQSSAYNKSLHSGLRRRNSSPSSSRGSIYSISIAGQTPQDFLRAGSSTKSARLMNTFLDVLRVFVLHKFICFCLDDLQFADDESLELISQIISSKIKMVVIVTYRPDEILPEKLKRILEPPDAEGISEHMISKLPCSFPFLHHSNFQTFHQYLNHCMNLSWLPTTSSRRWLETLS